MKRGVLALALLAAACSDHDPHLTPKLTLSTNSLAFSCTEGGANPATQAVTLTNTGDSKSTLNWSATSDQPWLSISPASGAQGTVGNAVLTISVNATFQVEAWTGTTSTTGAPFSGDGTWVGDALLIWGDSYGQTGTFYDPVSNTWLGSTTTVGAPSGRSTFSVVWTGTEFIVWGGITSGGAPLNTGGRYNVATDSWSSVSTTGAPDARFSHTAVWTGTHMIVWGGDSGGYSYKNTGGIYDPSTDTWIGSTTTTGAPSVRGHHSAVWTGDRMLIWGGENPSKFNTGYFYDPVSNTWTGTTTTTGAPAARSHHSAVWTGREMIIWGGGTGGPHLNTGGRYNPATDTWTGATTTTGAPNGRASQAACWTGDRMIIWGGEENGTLVNTGGIYRPPIPEEGPHTATITISAPGAVNSPQVITVDLTVNP